MRSVWVDLSVIFFRAVCFGCRHGESLNGILNKFVVPLGSDVMRALLCIRGSAKQQVLCRADGFNK